MKNSTIKYKITVDKNLFYSHIKNWKENYQLIGRSNWFVIAWIKSKIYLFLHPHAKTFIINENNMLSGFAKEVISLSQEYFANDPILNIEILKIAEKYGYVVNLNTKWWWVE